MHTQCPLMIDNRYARAFTAPPECLTAVTDKKYRLTEAILNM